MFRMMNTKIVYLFLIGIAGGVQGGVTSQDFYWREYSHGVVPLDAIEGRAGIYIGQVYYNNHGLIPAAIYPYRNAAVMVYGTRQNVKENIKILCSSEKNLCYWEPVNFAQNYTGQMINAVRGGFQDGQNLFVGITQHEGDWKIGKVKDYDKENERGLYIWDKDGKHVRIVEFELFKCNTTILPIFDIDVRTAS